MRAGRADRPEAGPAYVCSLRGNHDTRRAGGAYHGAFAFPPSLAPLFSSAGIFCQSNLTRACQMKTPRRGYAWGLLPLIRPIRARGDIGGWYAPELRWRLAARHGDLLSRFGAAALHLGMPRPAGPARDGHSSHCLIYSPFIELAALSLAIFEVEPWRLTKDDRRRGAVPAKIGASGWISAPKRKKGASGKDGQ